MNACAILNPTAGSAQQQALHAALEELSIDQWTTEGPGDATDRAAEAAAADYDRVIAMGGDGTIHEVVNGLMTAEAPPALAIVPLGTGNDLARTLALPTDPLEALALVAEGEARALDLIRVQPTDGATRYAINAAAGGFSGQVDEELTPEMKRRWGPLAFLLGAVSALPDIEAHDTRMAFDGEEPAAVDAFNVVVANGRMAGGGKPVAPVANPEDGKLDVVTVHAGTLVELSQVAAQLVAGTYLGHPLVTHRRARSVRVEASPGMWFNVDGELLTNEPVTFEAAPQALSVVVGPAYQAVPPTP
ncbi:MAG: YegS/Rv2252/BmrU family lipid kinase [Bacteroidetes bacterium]|nr:YegS/Rv2252/BmrU family lipid kinase [Bacteroidota bacterium]